MVSTCAIGEQRLGVAIVSVFVGLQADADWGGVAGRYCNRFIVTERLGDSVDSSQAECRDEKQWRFCSTGLYGSVSVRRLQWAVTVWPQPPTLHTSAFHRQGSKAPLDCLPEMSLSGGTGPRARGQGHYSQRPIDKKKCLSVAWYIAACLPMLQHTDCHEISYLRMFRNAFEKLQVWSKSHQNKKRAIYMKTGMCKFMISRLSLLTIRLFRYKLYRKTQHILCWVTFFLKIMPFIR